LGDFYRIDICDAIKEQLKEAHLSSFLKAKAQFTCPT